MGGVRPIAIGNTLRRLDGKIGMFNINGIEKELFWPHQVGVGVPLGGEIACHSIVSVETLGSWGAIGHKFITNITKEPKQTSFIFQAISIVVQKGMFNVFRTPMESLLLKNWMKYFTYVKTTVHDGKKSFKCNSCGVKCFSSW